MNKIRVIDLLNMISKGEEVPKQIEYRANLYRLDEDKNYRDVVDGSYFVEGLSFNLANLSDEVQIIEEQQDIDIVCIEELDCTKNYFKDGTELTYKLMYERINHLIKAVKQLDRKIKEK